MPTKNHLQEEIEARKVAGEKPFDEAEGWEDKLFNMILTFQPRTILQEAQPVKDIPEVCNGILDGDGYRKLVAFLKSEITQAREEEREEVLRIVENEAPDLMLTPKEKMWSDYNIGYNVAIQRIKKLIKQKCQKPQKQ